MQITTINEGERQDEMNQEFFFEIGIEMVFTSV